MNKKYLGAVVAILILIALAWWFESTRDKTPTTGEAVKIGAALGLSGDAAPWGEESLKSAQLAVDEINADGGINGRRLELVGEDMKSSVAGGVSAVSKLVQVDKSKAIMITWLDSYAGAESAVPKDMLMISQDAAIESVNTPTNHPNVFSLWYRTEAKSKVILDEMHRSNVKTVYIVLQHDAYYTKLLEFFKAEASKQGITVVGEELLNPTDDARTTVAKITEKKPDAVFFGSYDEKLSVSFLKRYSESGTKAGSLYGDEFIEQDLSNKNFSSSWMEGISYYVPATPDASFSKKFEKRFGHKPMFSAGTTYDTVYVIAKALKDNPENISSYMQKTKFDSVTYGPITFDSIGGVVSDKAGITMKKIVNGKIVDVGK